MKPITGPRIQAKGYRKGRAFHERKAVRILGVHTAEGAQTARDLGNFFHGNASGSSHAGIGQGGDFATFVNYSDTAWTMPPLNEESDEVELCGFAHWNRTQWMKNPQMLQSLAHWLAWRAEVRKIPLRLLTPADVKEGRSGIVMHRTTNDVFHLSDHWDPGFHLPWDYVLKKARNMAQVVPAPGRLVLDASKIRYAQMTNHQYDRAPALKHALAGQVGQGDMNLHTSELARAFDDQYVKWQHRCGFKGKSADGLVGVASLSRLGKLEGFSVQA